MSDQIEAQVAGMRIVQNTFAVMANGGDETELLEALTRAPHDQTCWAAAYLLSCLRELASTTIGKSDRALRAVFATAALMGDQHIQQTQALIDTQAIVERHAREFGLD